MFAAQPRPFIWITTPRPRRATVGTNARVMIAIAAVWWTPGLALAELPAFPGADGAAANASGGRGGLVYHVTELDRNFSDNRPGTLRYGLDDSNFDGSPRTIVFDVAGTFWLGRFGEERGHDNGWDSQSRLNFGSNVTIAGQTAPGPVNIMGGVTKAGGDNTILRNVTFAPGYGLRAFAKPEDGEFPTPGDFPDSFTFDGIDISGTNIMIDHVTTVYATDEAISANEEADHITIQYSNISQGQNYPQGDAEGGGATGHAFGSLLQGGSNASISVHHNLYAHQKGRLPRVGTEQDALSDPDVGAFNDFRNNVFYNWLFHHAGTGAGRQPSQNNFINNFYLAGPGGDDVSGADVVPRAGSTGIFDGDDPLRLFTEVFHSGNVKDVNKDGDAEDTIALNDVDFDRSAIKSAPLWFDGPTYTGVTDTAEDAFDRVLDFVGSRWWERATVDQRIIEEVRAGTGRVMAWADDPFNDDPDEGVEWRDMLALRADPVTGEAPFRREAGWDTDGDGMPDHWEGLHGLDPDVADHNGDFDDDGYTDLEEYLNDLAAWPAPRPIAFAGATNNRYAQITNWDITWQPSRFDAVQVNAGVAVVDAVGQHAGSLTIGAHADDVAELRISDGWLRVADELTIGGDDAADATLSLTGGELYTAVLSRGANGAFDFTGGELHADEVRFDLVNQGGTLAPGRSIGTTHVLGDLTILAGALRIELDDEGHDMVTVDEQAALGGALDAVPLDGFTPTVGQRWLILTADSIGGGFETVTPGYTYEVDGGQLYLVSQIPSPATLSLLAVALPLILPRRAAGRLVHDCEA